MLPIDSRWMDSVYELMLCVNESKSPDTTEKTLSLPERRQSPRYRIVQGLMAINPGILGPVLDLSMHGMTFEYSGESLTNEQFLTIGLFSTEQHTIITDIQVRTVRDHIANNTSSFIPLIRKIRAVEFINLSPGQKRQIKSLLDTLCPS